MWRRLLAGSVTLRGAKWAEEPAERAQPAEITPDEEMAEAEGAVR